MSAYLASYLAIAVSIRLLSGYLTVIEIGLLRSVGSLAIAASAVWAGGAEQRRNVLLSPGQRGQSAGSRPSCRRGSAIDPHGSRKNLQFRAFGQQRGNPAYKLEIIRLDEKTDRLARGRSRCRPPRRARAVGHAAADRGRYAIAHGDGPRHCRYWLHIAHAV